MYCRCACTCRHMWDMLAIGLCMLHVSHITMCCCSCIAGATHADGSLGCLRGYNGLPTTRWQQPAKTTSWTAETTTAVAQLALALQRCTCCFRNVHSTSSCKQPKKFGVKFYQFSINKHPYISKSMASTTPAPVTGLDLQPGRGQRGGLHGWHTSQRAWSCTAAMDRTSHLAPALTAMLRLQHLSIIRCRQARDDGSGSLVFPGVVLQGLQQLHNPGP